MSLARPPRRPTCQLKLPVGAGIVPVGTAIGFVEFVVHPAGVLPAGGDEGGHDRGHYGGEDHEQRDDDGDVYAEALQQELLVEPRAS